MAGEPLTKELLCVLTEIGFDKGRLQKNPHETIKAHAAAQVRDYVRMALLKLPSAAAHGEPAFEDLADVLALAKRRRRSDGREPVPAAGEGAGGEDDDDGQQEREHAGEGRAALAALEGRARDVFSEAVGRHHANHAVAPERVWKEAN